MRHYRKNVDPNFLSGEDLKYNLIKDMPDGVAVIISSIKDSEGYDQGKQEKVPVIELRFKDLKGVLLSKGVIPAKWTYVFMKQQGIMSPDVDKWVGQKLVIYAKPDARFGHVVRFKTYRDPKVKAKLKPDTESWNKAVKWLENPKNKIKDVFAKYDISAGDKKKLEAACKKE